MARVKTHKQHGRIVAAEDGTCLRCHQPITAGTRIVNEAGKFPAHRDCVRMHIAMPRTKLKQQKSAGWGAHCAYCLQTITKPQQWKKVGREVVHQDC